MAVLLTGATGFVGMEVLTRWLERGNSRVYALVRADDVAGIEPRWNLPGDALVWFVRSVKSADATATPDDPTRSEDEWLVDDATGAVLRSGGLAIDPTFQPARIWFQGTRGTTRLANALDNRIPAYEVSTVDQVLHSGPVDGTRSGHPGLMTYGPGDPLLLEAGDYTITFWLADPGADQSQGGAAATSCSGGYHFSVAQDLTLQADFGRGVTCTLSQLAAPSRNP